MSAPPFRRDDRSLLWVGAFLLLSVALHGLGLFVLASRQAGIATPATKPVELVMFEVEPPPPPPPEPLKVEEPPPPPKVKPPRIRVAKVQPPPEVPQEDTPPPPPNDAPPPEEPAKPVPLVVGISMSSTTAAGGYAAAVGNTTYGKTEKTATAPSEVKSYSAPKYMPAYQVDSQPEVLDEVRADYPEEAKRLGIEGKVMLKITIDTDGRVVEARVIRGIGYGLDQAAKNALTRFRFRPAIKSGEAVATTINYAYSFYLDE